MGKQCGTYLFVLISFFTLVTKAMSNEMDSKANADFFGLSLSELANINIGATATLTNTSAKLIPAAMTLITASDISLSGARGLNELLEIYVPGLQLVYHKSGFSHLGMRGIISNRDDKYMMLVNGKVMNQRSYAGAVSERDLVMLGDIHHIEVIRGPGSAVYGLGAVSMVINITTYDSSSKEEGGESITRLGYGRDLISQELSYNYAPDDGVNIYTYIGISKVDGSDSDNSPAVFGSSFTSRWGDQVTAGEDVGFDIGNDRGQYRDQPSIKLHTDIAVDDFNIWFRYTRGGEIQPLTRSNMAAPPVGSNSVDFDPNTVSPPNEVGYQQFTLATEYQQDFDNWHLKYLLSYDIHDWDRIVPVASAFFGGARTESHREDELFFRAQANWEPGGDHAIGVGIEMSHEKFGLDSPGFPDEEASSPNYPTGMPEWSTNTYSIFAEHQWLLSDNWTSFISGRLDKNTYSDTLFSPRLALVYTPSDTHAIKLILNRSQRMNFATELRKNHDEGFGNGEAEKMDSAELRWEAQLSPSLWFASSFFYEDLDVIASSSSAAKSAVIGNQKVRGLDVELKYQTGKTSIVFSHEYTKLIDFDLFEGSFTLITVMPNGIGEDLNAWANNLSKIHVGHQLNDKWTVFSSAQYYWDFPGTRDFIEFVNGFSSTPFQAEGSNRIDGHNFYWNLGTNYQFSKSVGFNVTGHYLAGLLDDDNNKRNYIATGDSYRNQGTAITASLKINF